MGGICLALLLGLAAVIAPARSADETSRLLAFEHYEAGQEALLGERWDRAEEEFGEAIRLDPVFVAAHHGLGKVYMATKRYPDAVRAFRRCRDAFHEGEADALMYSAEWEKRLDDQIRALEDQLRALQSGRLRTGTGSGVTTQSSIMRLEEQTRLLKSQRKRGDRSAEPTPAFISLALGSAHFRAGSFADAEREYKAALDVDRRLGEAHNNLAVVCMLAGRLEEAQKEIALAEKYGFRVNLGLKQDIERQMKARQPD